MIRRCTGPNGEPGFQADIDGVLSECFTYDPANILSKVAAERKVADLHDQAVAAEVSGAERVL